ncbi:MAG TPA: hypothetical protein VGR13_05790, partial [Actinomycetota bacterium]|nr:hypothetical protein [Actinomycetota bacterium]
MKRRSPAIGTSHRVIGSLSCLLVIAGLLNVAVLTGPAQATIDPGSTAQQVADAINSTGGAVTGTFQTKPPSGNPDAVSDSSLASFPTDGSNYGILTTGDANLADDSNSSGSSGATDDGPNIRGNTDFDVSILQVAL